MKVSSKTSITHLPSVTSDRARDSARPARADWPELIDAVDAGRPTRCTRRCVRPPSGTNDAGCGPFVPSRARGPGGRSRPVDHPYDDPIPTSTCWELLRDVSFARVALSIHALPMILPVEYCVDGDELAICLGHYQLTQRTVDNTVVCFAADAIDAVTRTGWTIQVQGVARLRHQIGVPTECGQPEAGQIVHITPQTISGQHLQLCPFGTGLPALALPKQTPP